MLLNGIVGKGLRNGVISKGQLSGIRNGIIKQQKIPIIRTIVWSMKDLIPWAVSPYIDIRSGKQINGWGSVFPRLASGQVNQKLWDTNGNLVGRIVKDMGDPLADSSISNAGQQQDHAITLFEPGLILPYDNVCLSLTRFAYNSAPAPAMAVQRLVIPEGLYRARVYWFENVGNWLSFPNNTIYKFNDKTITPYPVDPAYNFAVPTDWVNGIIVGKQGILDFGVGITSIGNYIHWGVTLVELEQLG